MSTIRRSRTLFPAVALAALMSTALAPAHARIYEVAAMNTAQLAALDKSKTVVILPGGIFEEHGPYLPSNTDGYVSERQSKDVADAIVQHGWNVLVFPQLVLGAGGANELAAKYPFPGTYVVRLDTLRSVYMDLADELGEAGFRYVFMIHSHGAPNHGRILGQAGDYFSETYKGRMLRLSGFGPPNPADPRNALSEQAKQEDAGSGHAGIDETSLMLYLRPDLVSPEYKNAPAFTAAGDGGMISVAKRADWTGYFGAPKYASAEYGAKLYEISTTNMIQQAIKILDAPVDAAPASQRRPRRNVDDAAIARDSTIAKRQQEWLKKNEQQ